MDFAHSAEDVAFRDELRAWLDENLPKFLAEWGEHDADARWAAGRPRDHGRDGAAPRLAAHAERGPVGGDQLADGVGRARRDGHAERHLQRGDGARSHAGHLQRERLVADRPDDHPVGHRRAEGPLAPEHPQRRRALVPGLQRAQAGSDLANLRTLAVRDGDDYVLNGQKIWISSAHIAKWGLFLVRTDPTAIERGAKHEGITALIIDLRRRRHRVPSDPRHHRRRDVQRGVLHRRARPGRLPPRRRGRRAGRWRWARSATSVSAPPASPSRWRPTSSRWSSLARAVNPDALRDPELRERIARAHTDIEYTRLLNYRALSKILKGEPNWPEVPLAKLQWSLPRADARRAGRATCSDRRPCSAKGGPDAVDGGAWNRLFVFQRYTSIGAGTTEVQKNIIADRAIKLPAEVTHAEAFDDGGVGHAAALAHGLEAVATAGGLELVEQRRHQPHTGRAERMTDARWRRRAGCSRSRGRAGTRWAHIERDRGERLVALDGVEVVDRHARSREQLAGHRVRRRQHEHGVVATDDHVADDRARPASRARRRSRRSAINIAAAPSDICDALPAVMSGASVGSHEAADGSAASDSIVPLAAGCPRRARASRRSRARRRP